MHSLIRKFIAFVLLALFTVAVFPGLPIQANNAQTAGEGYRIALDAGSGIKAGITIRHKLGGGRVSAHITAAQKQKLDQAGITYEIVPVRTINALAAGKPQTTKAPRVFPATQVPYGIKMIYGDPALDITKVSGGAGVTVAVLDTGIINHPDFTRLDGTKVIKQLVDFSQTKSGQVEGVAVDKNGHGTHVTGTIAAAGGLDGKGIFGVAPQADIFSYKVLNDRGSGYVDDIARAIMVAADRGANIISMSLGSSAPTDIELNAIQYAQAKGVLVIAAAGNAGPNPNSIGYPGGYSEVVGVASLNPDEIVSYYSSRGITDGNDNTISDREVEVAAPGRNIISTYKDGGYYVMSGTSMATPHIAGLAAKTWQGSADSTRTWLKQSAGIHDIVTAEMVNNAGPGYDIAAGYGLPQVIFGKQDFWKN